MPTFPRSSGVLLHVTSLPGEYGIGDLGPAAFRFIDFLSAAGQSLWQILPLGPTIQCHSPYSSYSAFAGNPLLISPIQLVEDGFLQPEDLNDLLQVPLQSHVDFASAEQVRLVALERAFQRFQVSQACAEIDEFEAFCTLQQGWLRDFALFAALIEHYGNDQWTTWEPGIVHRDRPTLASWRERLAGQVQRQQFIQFLFFSQWQQVKRYANQRGIRIFGDMPIFVSHGSADVWAGQSLFHLDQDGHPTVVAGVPPDYFSQTGQLWGNPLYRWDRLEETGYRWWISRIGAAFQLYDVLRIDHFRGFEAYWEIPAGAPTAVQGRWLPGPGAKMFDAVRSQLGELPIVAEDLGLITKEVHQLREQLEFPGMRVLQFGFDSPTDGFHRPENYPLNSVAYTGTHDNETIIGWYRARQQSKQQSGQRDVLDRYLAADTRDDDVHWQLISMVMNSASHTVIVPMQDALGLGNEARMNFPGTVHGNWCWRAMPQQINSTLAAHLRVITEHSERYQLASVR
ncbi:MAG: 4-alpha-glucanotransferase [Pirellulaceae bacterium]|nr:4-alpha-glucanotransferase [Pirellulaceae bacterium]